MYGNSVSAGHRHLSYTNLNNNITQNIIFTGPLN